MSPTSLQRPNGYSADRAWSDRFIPIIKRIVGPHLLCEAPLEIDCHQAADLMVMRARDMTIACRVRRPGFSDQYPFEFTIRWQRDSGVETEMSKIINGWCDWMFYGHAGSGEPEITRWFLIDMSAWRAHGIKHPYNIRQGTKDNGDGTWFKWFDLRTFIGRPDILVASSHPVPQVAFSSAKPWNGY